LPILFLSGELKRYTYNNNMPNFGRIEIPTLAEVIDLAGNRIPLHIELKTRPTRQAGMEKKRADLLEGNVCGEKVTVSSFDPDQLLWAKDRGLNVFAWVVHDRETLERYQSSGFIDAKNIFFGYTRTYKPRWVFLIFPAFCAR
jgi:glycerophosphoryl diester phosphodiesterase